MLDKLTFHCNLCSSSDTVTYDELQSHLEIKHNKLLYDKCILKDYYLVYAQDDIKILSPLQNVYLNYKIAQEEEKIFIA